MSFLSRRTKEKTIWIDDSDKQDVILSMTDKNICNQVRALGLTLEDLKIAKTIQGLIKENVETIASQFYEAMCHIPEYEAIVHTHSTKERWVRAHGDFITTMLDGSFDDSYIDRLKQIATGHQQIGVLPQWYVASFQIIQQHILDILYRSTDNREEFYLISTSLAKILNFHQQVILETLQKANIESRQAQFQEIKESLKSKIFETSETLVNITEETSASVEELVQKGKLVNAHGEQSAEKTKREIEELVGIIIEIGKETEKIIQATEQLTEAARLA